MELRTLGTAQVLDASGQALAVQQKQLALLSYLTVAHPRGPHRRDTLLALFYPEHDQEHARMALRQLFRGLRAVVGEAGLQSGRETVCADGRTLGCDVLKFEDALSAEDFETAAELYDGPFLHGFHLRGSAAFERWVDEERARLARAYAGALEQLALRAGAEGNFRTAAEWWRRLSAEDPYTTHVTVRLMETLAAAGDRAGALRVAEEHAARLREEFGAEPSPDVVQVAARLREEPDITRVPARGSTRQRLAAALEARYRIDQLLGTGGMALVYLAEDLKLRRQVAIKVLRPELAAAIGGERFLQEIEIAANLSHPNILPLHDSGQAEDLLYYVMPYVEGESLRDRLSRQGSLPPNEASQIAREVAGALGYAHERGIVHRDIKPANILFVAGHAVVSDFGVAQAVGEAVEDRAVLANTGTPAYMSPEQTSSDQPLDERSDLYSLGCVLYEMLSGQPPTKSPKSPVSPLGRRISRDIEDTVMTSLEHDPANRFATAAQFATALDTPKTARRLPLPRTAKGKVVLGAVATTVVAAAALGVGRVLGPPPSAAPPRIAVLPFVNRTGIDSLDLLGSFIAEAVTVDLASTSSLALNAVPTTVVRSAIAPGSDGADGTVALIQTLDLALLVSGSYSLRGDSLAIETEIRDVADNLVLARPDAVLVFPPNQETAVEWVLEWVHVTLAAHVDPRLTDVTALTALPISMEAYREYALGVEGWQTYHRAEAYEHYRRAVELDSTAVSALLGMAQTAWQRPRGIEEVDSLLSAIEPLRETFTPYDRARFDNMLAWIRGDLESAWRASLAANEISGGFDACLASQDLIRVNRSRDILRIRGSWYGNTVYRHMQPCWYWLIEAHHLLGDHHNERREAQHAQEEIPGIEGFGFLEMRALAALGEVDEVRAWAERQQRVERLQPFWAYQLALEFNRHGWPQAAREFGELAVRLFRTALADVADPAFLQVQRLARSLYFVGEWDEAREIFASLEREIPDDFALLQYGELPSRATVLGYLGIDAARRGDTVAAEQMIDRLEQLDHPYLFGRNKPEQARIAAQLGQPDRALRFLQEGYSQGQQYRWEESHAVEFAALWDYEPFQRWMAPRD